MPDSKLSALVELAAAPATADEVYIRDVSEPAADESKRITIANLFAGQGGTPAPVLSTTNAAGAATTFLRTNDQLAIFDTTVPVTQASADAAATGTAAIAARRDHRHGMPTLGAGAVTRAGGNTTDTTTTSTTTVDLLTLSAISIGVALPIIVWVNVRKTTGAADQILASLKLNTTALSIAFASSPTNQAESSVIVNFLGGRVTSYAQAGMWLHTADAPGNVGRLITQGIDIPLATITDVVATGRTVNASITLGQDEMQVYSMTGA